MGYGHSEDVARATEGDDHGHRCPGCGCDLDHHGGDQEHPDVCPDCGRDLSPESTLGGEDH